MRNLQEATERICELKGNLVALDALVTALPAALQPSQRVTVQAAFARHAEVARTVLLHAPVSEHTVNAFELDCRRHAALLAAEPWRDCSIESLLLATVRIAAGEGTHASDDATGFFFARDDRIHLVTSRHVLVDPAGGHRRERIEIELHTDDADVRSTVIVPIELYRHGSPRWIESSDVAALEIGREVLPPAVLRHAFTPANLEIAALRPQAGTTVHIVGFPHGFHDTVHRLPVVRQASIASAFGLPFQGRACCLVEGRALRGMSGAPVVMPMPAGRRELPWALLGVHSTRIDPAGREPADDPSLGLSPAWYGGVLMALTQREPDAVAAA